MSLEAALGRVTAIVEALPVTPPYRRARTDRVVEGAAAERVFILQIVRRIGPLDTGIDPRVRYQAVLVFQLRNRGPKAIDADQERLAYEARDIARALERDGGAPTILVRETTYRVGEGGTDLARIGLEFVLRET